MPEHIARDAASRRVMDDNGFLHVADNPVSRVQVAPYHGREIPGWEELGLNPERVYRLYRPADELQKAAPTINGLPVELMHHDTTADNLPKAEIIGSTGTDARFDGEYLGNSLHITDADAIARIMAENPDERLTELSLAYWYTPDMTPGEFWGEPYDGVMRDIRGNHLALVDQGRAGPSVAVADRQSVGGPTSFTLKLQRSGIMGKLGKFLGRMARDEDPEKTEAESGAAGKEAGDAAHVDAGVNKDDDAAITALVASVAAEAGLSPEAAAKLEAGLRALMNGEATGDADALDEDAEGANDGSESGGAEDDEADPAADDNEPPAAKNAQDRAFRRYGKQASQQTPKQAYDRSGMALDGALARMQGIMDAQREVRPLAGEVNVNIATDSAATVYGYALKALGVDTRGMNRSSYRDVYRTAADAHMAARLSGQLSGHLSVGDGGSVSLDGPFAHLNNIKLG